MEALPPGRMSAKAGRLPRTDIHVNIVLTAIFVAALMLRLAMVPCAGVYHPDELFQYLEQAHRLVFGNGIVPWEYRYGMRSWLLPALITGPMAIGSALAPASTLYILLPRAISACMSMTIVWSAWRLGRRQSATSGLLAAAISAGWAEFVYFAPHILSETLSLSLILPAAILLTEPALSSRRLMASGLLLGLAVLLRLQHFPAVVTLILLSNWRIPRNLLPLVAGALSALALGGAVDLTFGTQPFAWAIEYVRQNILFGRAAGFGTAPSLAYVQAIGQSLGWFALPIVALAALGARREPVLLRIALVNLAVHMAIGHKEYRFVLLTTAILLLLAALGTGDLIYRISARWPRRATLFLFAALVAWAAMSVMLAAACKPALYAAGARTSLAPFDALRSDPALCGLAVRGQHFSAGGGYTYLHRNVPIYSYGLSEEAIIARDAPGYNRLLAPSAVSPPSGFRRSLCFENAASSPAMCIFVRDGTCTPIRTSAEINRLLVRSDQ